MYRCFWFRFFDVLSHTIFAMLINSDDIVDEVVPAQIYE